MPKKMEGKKRVNLVVHTGQKVEIQYYVLNEEDDSGLEESFTKEKLSHSTTVWKEQKCRETCCENKEKEA